MRKYLITASIWLTVILNLNGQSNPLIDSLNYILFEDIPQQELTYEFYYQFDDKNYSRIVRYNDLRSKPVSRICEAIRKSKDQTLISALKEILLKQEDFFLKEWEIAWKDGGGPRNIYEDQYNILVDIDVTISFLLMEQQQWNKAQKYAYLKNLFQLTQGDYNKDRVNQTLFISNYIRNEKTGYCSSDLFLPSTFQNTLIDQYSDELLENILSDINSVQVSELSDGEKKYYLVGLRKILVSNHDKRIDTLLIEKPNFFDALDYLKLSQNKQLLSSKYYHLLLDRYMLNNQNVDLLSPIVNDLTQDTKNLSKNKNHFSLFLSKARAYGSKILINEFAQKIAQSSQLEAQEFMDFSIDLLTEADTDNLKKQLFIQNPTRASQYQELLLKSETK